LQELGFWSFGTWQLWIGWIHRSFLFLFFGDFQIYLQGLGFVTLLWSFQVHNLCHICGTCSADIRSSWSSYLHKFSGNSEYSLGFGDQLTSKLMWSCWGTTKLKWMNLTFLHSTKVWNSKFFAALGSETQSNMRIELKNMCLCYCNDKSHMQISGFGVKCFFSGVVFWPFCSLWSIQTIKNNGFQSWFQVCCMLLAKICIGELKTYVIYCRAMSCIPAITWRQKWAACWCW